MTGGRDFGEGDRPVEAVWCAYDSNRITQDIYSVSKEVEVIN